MKIKIDVTKEVTSRLPFEPFEEFNDLCIGHLTDVDVTMTDSKEDAKWEFAGMKVPMLSFRFTQHKRTANEKERFATMSFMPISNQLADGTDREDSKIQTSYVQMWDKIKHLHDQYLGNENYAPISTVPEFDNSLTEQERLDEFTAFFTGIMNDFKLGKDKTTPIYADKQNLAMVMVASGKNLTYLAFPDFVGKGIFEPFVSKDGKIITTLKIPIGKTIVLGAAASQMASQPTGGAMNTDLPPELQALVNKG